MAYNKTTWENAPSTNTPINANNLNKIEEGIYQNSLKADQVGDLSNLETTNKSTIVGAINEVNEFKDGEVYSTSEVKTNGVWINNKPIYRKVIEINKNNLVSGDNNITYDFSTIDTITNLDLICERQYNIACKIPLGINSSSIDSWSGSFSADKANGYFMITLGSTIASRLKNGYGVWIIFEYTKTTD